MADQVRSVLQVLGELAIPYQLYEHPPVFTAEDAAAHWASIPATGVKNLFLRNKKGDRHYLAILAIEREADLRRLVKLVGDDRLSFGSPERLMTQLGLTPGSVSPFGLINNRDGRLVVLVDDALRSAERLIFHPNLNTASIAIAVSDFERFLQSRPNVVRWLRL
jgi:Ala-tRNA(Pro) deacylase